ncbi:MAG: hypothetical protein QM754_01190 [Tepidisphaeraceae bacterium]
MSLLFSPITSRCLTLRNRVGFSPMCTFRGHRGFVTDFHREHYAARAHGGAGLVMVEATAVEARGVIAPDDLGIWADDHVAGLADIANRIKAGGAAAGIQLAHAGRKAGAFEDVDGTKNIDVVGPSAIPFDAGRPVPRALSADELIGVREAYVKATQRAIAAGFEMIELHCARLSAQQLSLAVAEPTHRRLRRGDRTTRAFPARSDCRDAC